MTFDALTIAGILSAALSGGFVLATAMIQSATWSAHARSLSASFAKGRHFRRPAVTVLRRAPRQRFRPATAELT
jgi:hypothetical protein